MAALPTKADVPTGIVRWPVLAKGRLSVGAQPYKIGYSVRFAFSGDLQHRSTALQICLYA